MQYILPNEAKDELLKRAHLKPEVNRYFEEQGVKIPFSSEKPVAFVGMPAMMRVDTVSIVNLSEKCGLDLVWGTYDGDSFSHNCNIKLSLVSPVFTSRLDKSGGFIPKGTRFFKKPDDLRGMKLSDLTTPTGLNVVSFHKERLIQAMPQVKVQDLTRWLGQFGNAANYYDAVLSLFIAHGVMIDDFHEGEVAASELTRFRERVAQPAFERVSKKFGVTPLIVKMPWKPYYSYHLEGDMLVNWREMVLPRL